MKILLIEDSKFQRIASGRALINAGYTVIYAGDGEEGLRAARENIPDLILLDMYLSSSHPRQWEREQKKRARRRSAAQERSVQD